MSIAVSAVVRPSRLLLVLVSVVCLCVIVIAVLVGCNYFNTSPAWLRLSLASIYFFLASICWAQFYFTQKFCLISISSSGQIRLLELGSSTRNELEEFSTDSAAWLVVKLLENSTLWPQLLLLRLRSETGRLIVLPILSDSVSFQSFKSLSVACRWITVRINRNDNEIA